STLACTSFEHRRERGCALHLPANPLRGDVHRHLHNDCGVRNTLPPKRWKSRRTNRRLHRARTDLDIHSARYLHFHFRVVSGYFFPRTYPTERLNRGVHGRKAVDVEIPTHRGAAG